MTMQRNLEMFRAAWIAAGTPAGAIAMDVFEKHRAQMPAFEIARADSVFRGATRWPGQRRWPGVPRYFAERLRSRPKDWPALISDDPPVALLMMHASDGFLRAHAVREAPVTDTAARTALLLRCNDWATPVREVAQSRFEEIMPGLTIEEMAPLCIFVLTRVTTWQRGGSLAALRMTQHPAWPEAVRLAFMTADTGPLARSLRGLLRAPAWDALLPDLAAGARSAFVRLVAVQSLLERHVKWSEGYTWQWHNKVFNQRRRVPRFGQREVVCAPEVREQIRSIASQDKSARVRCLVAECLIRDGPSGADALVTDLMVDPAISVRERMEFFKKKWGGNIPAPVSE